MIEGKPSHTALRVAVRRAAHQLLDRPLVLDDPLALRIIPEDRANALRAGGTERGPLAPYMRAFFAVRSRVAEDELRAAVGRGVNQYVVLGAGLDTFAYRNPFPSVRVFEVDFPATQQWKRERLGAAGMEVPPSVTYVATDFQREPIQSVLQRAGYDPARPAVYCWLGVTPYLASPVVHDTLRWIAPAIAGGGALVFDYAVPPSQLTLTQRIVFEMMAASVRKVGEPWITFLDPTGLSRDMRAMGFGELDDLGGEELNRRYFSGRTDGLRVGGMGRIMAARGA